MSQPASDVKSASFFSSRLAHRAEWFSVAAIFLAVNLVSALVQHPLTFHGGKAWELSVYYDLASQLRHGLPLIGAAPAVYRIGAPWLAAILPFDIERNFFLISLTANVVTIGSLVILLRMFVDSWKIRTALLAAFMLHWLGPIRFLYFVAADTDAIAIMVIVLGLLAIERWKRRERPVDYLVVLAVVILGSFFREIALTIGVLFLFVPTFIDEEGLNMKRLMLTLTPIVCGAAALAGLHYFIHAKEEYSFASSALNWSYTKSLPVFLLGIAIAIGPVACLLVLDWKRTAQLLRQHREIGAGLALVLLLALVGGSDTERFILWGTPLILIVYGSWFERNRVVLRDYAFVGILVVLQLIAERLFWTTPDLGYSVTNTPIFLTSLSSNAYYLNLYSYHAPKAVSALMLLEYLAVYAVIISWAAYATSRRRREMAAED